MPDGYSKEDISIEKAEDADEVTIITIPHDDPNQSVFVSQQPPPAGYDFEAFEKSIDDSTTFSTSAGWATMGLLSQGGRTSRIVIIANDESWILINTLPTGSGDTLKSISEYLIK